MGLPPPWDFEIDPFLDHELVAALKILNGKAATGPQRVLSKYIKHVFGNSVARVPLLLLFNRCFITGTVPLAWVESEVFVPYKGKGLRSFPTNYRFINLNNDFLRLYERLLQARFDRWLFVNRPWGPMQFGFTPRVVPSTDTLSCLRTLALVFTRHFGIPCYAIFLDLKKAFPSINRAESLRALLDLGVPYELVRAFASTFLLNLCKLVINVLLTGSVTVNKGTKEGGINSPPIFNSAYVTVLRKLNISEFPRNPEEVDSNSIYYVVFADDLVLVSANLTRLEEETNRLDAELLCVLFVNRPCTQTISLTVISTMPWGMNRFLGQTLLRCSYSRNGRMLFPVFSGVFMAGEGVQIFFSCTFATEWTSTMRRSFGLEGIG
jgi:hypothetical protein